MITTADIPLFQIAGVCDDAEARMLIHAGVAWLGFPLRLTVNQEDLTEAEAAAIIRSLPLGVHGVLITYLTRADDILTFCGQLGARTVQLHGPVGLEDLREIKRCDPELTVFKSLVVRPGNEETLRRTVQESTTWVDAFITDTFNPATGQEGATGLIHDWAISRRLVDLSPKPVILAGGLHAGNVADAVLAVRPAGVDAHTGLEGPDGRKDPRKVARFISEAHRAFQALAF